MLKKTGFKRQLESQFYTELQKQRNLNAFSEKTISLINVVAIVGASACKIAIAFPATI